MKTVHLAQPNHSFGNNAFLPYSVATLWAYAMNEPELPERFQLARSMQFSREPFEDITMFKPDILALSCYIWNWEYNMALAKAVKTDNPECVVVIGGPQVTIEAMKLPWVNVVVFGEGESALSDVLDLFKDGTPSPTAKMRVYANRSTKLDFPSPYVEGYFDEIIEAHPKLNFHALWETHRGCPYSCTFCDWGSATHAKVTKFEWTRLEDEITWFAENKIELVYNCDANFGMLPRDEDLIDSLIAYKQINGYPEKIRAAYPKIHTDRIVNQNVRLHKSGLAKGVTISLQSLDEKVLDAVKRKNIAIDDFEHLNQTYLKQGIPTYTELILGLPGETAETFLKGIERLLQAGQHAGLAIYPCMVLPNSELNDPEYKKEFQITSVRVQQMLLHATPSNNIPEYYEMVVSTKDMPYTQWKYCLTFAYFVQALHCLGLTRYVAQWYCEEHKKDYIEFYSDVIEWAINHPGTGLATTFELFIGITNHAIHGGSWDLVVEDCGGISWPPEEAAFLQLMTQPAKLLDEVGEVFLGGIPTFVKDTQLGLLRHKAFDESREDWAREAVWYGRKEGGTYAKTN
jgi:radical SAM superfamily enzyme YgiQ (UPF0313 family)